MNLTTLVDAAIAIEREGRDAIAAATTPDALAAARVSLVGRKNGRLTELMKALPALAPDERLVEYLVSGARVVLFVVSRPAAWHAFGLPDAERESMRAANVVVADASTFR